MDDRSRFQEMLTGILEVARVQENRLSTGEIKAMLGEMELTKGQYEQIYAYLAANHIKIAGYADSVNEYTKAVRFEERALSEEGTENNKKESGTKAKAVSKEDSIYLKMYLEDLEAVPGPAPDEWEDLIRIIQGNGKKEYARSRFIEINLPYVVQIAGEYRNQGLILEDLIQEGNIGLLSSLERMDELTDRNQWKEFITQNIRNSIEAAIQEQNGNHDFEHKILEKIKYMNDAANELAEDLGRKADIHELAACTNMSEEEIQEILKLSKDALELGSCGHDHCCQEHHEGT